MTLIITFCLSSKPNNNLRQTNNQFKNISSNYYLKLMFNWNFLSNYNTNDVKHFQKGLVSKLYETNLWVNLNWDSHYIKTIYSYSINWNKHLYKYRCRFGERVASRITIIMSLKTLRARIRAKRRQNIICLWTYSCVYTPMASTMLCHVKVR